MKMPRTVGLAAAVYFFAQLLTIAWFHSPPSKAVNSYLRHRIENGDNPGLASDIEMSMVLVFAFAVALAVTLPVFKSSRLFRDNAHRIKTGPAVAHVFVSCALAHAVSLCWLYTDWSDAARDRLKDWFGQGAYTGLTMAVEWVLVFGCSFMCASAVLMLLRGAIVKATRGFAVARARPG